MKKKLLIILMVISVLMLSIVPSVSVSAADNDVTIDDNSMYNSYLKMVLESDMGLDLYTTGGNPDTDADDDARLLYKGTSYTTVVIDSLRQRLSGSHIVGDVIFDAESKSITNTWDYDGVLLTQKFSFIKNTATGREDIVEMSYTFKNTTDDVHTTGLRIMIDTMLGSNDDAPFRIPNIGAVTTMKEFTGDDIPVYFQAFDNLDNPSVISQGSFDINSNNKPDKVQFISWPNLTAWETPIDESKEIGDSAVTSTWYAKDLQPGEERTYKMYYGLSQLVIDATSDLQFAAFGENDATPNENNDGYNNIIVTAYINNNGNADLTNTNVTINLTEGMALAEGETTQNVGNIAPGEEKQVSWTVSLTPSAAAKTLNYSVTASADENEDKTVELAINLPAVNVPEPPSDAPTEPVTEAPTASPTEPQTELPTAASTQSATSAKIAPTNSTTSATTVTTNTTNNTNGKSAVKTGSSENIILILACIGVLSSATVFALKTSRKKSDR